MHKPEIKNWIQIRALLMKYKMALLKTVDSFEISGMALTDVPEI